MADYLDVIVYGYDHKNKYLPIAQSKLYKNDIILRIGDQYMDKNKKFYTIESDGKNVRPFNIKNFILVLGFFIITMLISLYKLLCKEELNAILFVITIMSFLIVFLMITVFGVGNNCFFCEIYDKRISNCVNMLLKCIAYMLGFIFILVLFFI